MTHPSTASPPALPDPSCFDLSGLHWKKPWRSGGGGNCPQFARVKDFILLRDDADLSLPPAVWPVDGIRALFEGITAGEFDHLTVHLPAASPLRKPPSSAFDQLELTWEGHRSGGGSLPQFTRASAYLLLRDGSVLRPPAVWTVPEMQCLFDGVKEGEFDYLLTAPPEAIEDPRPTASPRGLGDGPTVRHEALNPAH